MNLVATGEAYEDLVDFGFGDVKWMKVVMTTTIVMNSSLLALPDLLETILS